LGTKISKKRPVHSSVLNQSGNVHQTRRVRKKEAGVRGKAAVSSLRT